MKKTNLKKAIIIIFVLLIIILVVQILLNKKKNQEMLKNKEIVESENKTEEIFEDGGPDGNTIMSEDDDIVVETESIIAEVKNEKYYILIKNCVENYYKIMGSEDISNEQKIAILDQQYIDEYKINTDNVTNILSKKYDFFIKNMYTSMSQSGIYLFWVDGKCIDGDDETSKNESVIVRLDETENAYSVIPYEFLKRKNINENNFNNLRDNKIELNQYNKAQEVKTTDLEIANTVFLNYKKALIYDLEFAYEKLNNEYRETKFGSYDNFKEYINKNINRIKKSNISTYKVTQEYENINDIRIEDNNGSVYVIQEYTLNDYSVMLDEYTVTTEVINKNYYSKDERKKAEYNTKLIVTAIKDRDYNFLYGKLNEQFKKNNFKTIESLITCIEQRFLNMSKEEISNAIEKNGSYIVEVNYIETETKKDQKINFVIKLGEETDFQFAFSMN